MRTQANRVARHFKWGKAVGRLLKYTWWKPRAKKSAKHILPYIPRGANVLDIGAGNGLIAEIIAKERDAEITLVDVMDWNLSSLPLRLYDGGRLPFQDDQFDIALLCDVVHHAENEEALVKEALRVARKVIIVEEAHEHSGMSIFANVADNLQYILYGMPLGVHSRNGEQWLHFFQNISSKARCVGTYLQHAVYVLER